MPIVGITDRAGMFMEIGRIRKGEEKSANAPGKNLDYFRVVFRPDEKAARDVFLATYGETPRQINVRLAYPDIARNWEAWYEAHSKGGMVAQATGDKADGGVWHYYYDSESGQVHIKDYLPRDEIGERLVAEGPSLDKPIPTGGKPTLLKMAGKLKLVIPEIGRVGHMTLVTTSIHDIAAISQEIQGYADEARLVNSTLCNIPFVLLRREEMITKKIDGKKVKAADWMCHIIPSGEWTNLAMTTWKRLSLEDIVEGETRILPAPKEQLENWDEEEEFPQIPSVSSAPITAPAPAPQPTGEVVLTRPYSPPVFKAKLLGMVAAMPAVYEKSGLPLTVGPNDGKILASIIDAIFNGDKGVSRHIVCSWLIGTGSTKDMTAAQVKALFHIMGIKGEPRYESPPSVESMEEFRAALVYAQEAVKA